MEKAGRNEGQVFKTVQNLNVEFAVVYSVYLWVRIGIRVWFKIAIIALLLILLRSNSVEIQPPS